MAPIEIPGVPAQETDAAVNIDADAQPEASSQPAEPSVAMVPAGAFPAPSHTLRVPVPAIRPYPFTTPALVPRARVEAQPAASAPEEDAFAGLTALGPVPHERKARDYALVLQSMSLWHVIRRSNAGWVLLVRDADYAKASGAIDHYEEENRDWPPRPVRERPRHAASPLTPLLFLTLIAFFLVTGPVAAESHWFTQGTAVTQQVLGSQPWRAVTALTLHADGNHVLGNAISGTVFASAVHRRLGAGGSALAILASGILGNVGNALWHRSLGDPWHGSIGASTAVFGAIGLLAATQVVVNFGVREQDRAKKQPRSWTDIAGPLVGGLALLGALGSGGPTTDLGAHLFGFLAGVGIGAVVAWPQRGHSLSVDAGSQRVGHTVAIGSGAPSWWIQTALGGIAAAIVVVAWELALRH
jgi:membrane associated rhomboid family serine protease